MDWQPQCQADDSSSKGMWSLFEMAMPGFCKIGFAVTALFATAMLGFCRRGIVVALFETAMPGVDSVREALQ